MSAAKGARAALRQRLLAARLALSDHGQRTEVLAAQVARWLAAQPYTCVAAFWPVRGEPDLLPMLAQWLAADAQRVAALPVIEGDVLRFAPWTPAARMQPGPHHIAVPATAKRVRPQALLIPCVGIDGKKYRLGYGGGYYDRTLAVLAPRPFALGVAFDCARVKSIAPQAHDIALDAALTESGFVGAGS
ncbi:MAG: 5-formyltetrahydrofolate cyclo-ligase [Betaproteobacteria bacterium]